MTDITKAITAAREALARLREHDGGTRYNGDDDDAGERACCLVASWKPHDSDCPHAVAVAEFDRLLAALGAAQGEAVLGSVQSGSVTIPFWVIDYAQKIELFMKVNGVDAWALGGIQSRDLPPPKAPPAAVPTNVRERWNIERDGDALRVCFNDHEKGEECEYVRYVSEAPYAELLYAVESKWPGESRHETALRYIREREAGTASIAALAADKENGNG